MPITASPSRPVELSVPEPLKNIYSRQVVSGYAKAIAGCDRRFNVEDCLRKVFDRAWAARELKDRMHHIARCLYEGMSGDYPDKIRILMTIAPQFNGLACLVFPDIVEQYGIQHLEVSIKALECFTPMGSSEFAVRPFIIQYPEQMMKQMEKWSRSKNEHVRRLASEGCRPRLPWAIALPDFKRDPSPVLPVLERLRTDPSEYVRRSVANNLNDISKDHPALVLKIAARWLREKPETLKLVKHACRTQLKKGDKNAMALFGYDDRVAVKVSDLRMESNRVNIGGVVAFSFTITVPKNASALLRIEYAIDYMKSRGQHGRKVFKITERTFSGTEHITRKHRVHDLTTRVHYPGRHHVYVIVNGKHMAAASFELT